MKSAILPLGALSLLCSLGLVACGGSDEGGGSGANPEKPGAAPDSGAEPAPPEGEDPCGLNSGYEGDENCILPPQLGAGSQLHIGPSSYDDPDVINATDEKGNYLWLMIPGDERTECFHAVLPNAEEFHYFEQQYRMRTGSHHMILRGSNSTDPVEGWGKCSSNIIASFGGTQHTVENFPPDGVVAPEDEGLGHLLPAHATVDAQLHFYNTTDQTRLREAWVNFKFKPADEVTTNLGMLGAFTGMNVPPHSQKTIYGECKSEQAIVAPGVTPRIVALFGHAHSHNKRFLVEHDRADGSTETVYDSYDGAEAPTYTYNSRVQIPVADPANRISGGRSGLLTLAAGEKLRFSCDVVNDTDLTFLGKNEVNDDEMCHLFGSVAGAGFPCFALPN